MNAVRIHAYGGPEVLQYEEAPRPEITSEDVLVRVYAAGVNPIDWKIREGHMKQRIDYPLPMIPGWDVSGVVEEVGANVTDISVGQEVYSKSDITRNGAYAEYIAVRASEVAPKPQSIDHVRAAAVPLAALTAWQSLFDQANLSTGQTVLIHGAAGGVGTFAVQFARWKGALIFATGSARNARYLSDLGADQVIDYHRVRFEDIVRDADVVFDTLGGETQQRSWQTLRPGGILVSTIEPPDEEEARRYDARTGFVFTQPNREELVRIAALIDGGRVRSIARTVLPLSEARRAQEISQEGHVRGKIVLHVTDGD